MAKAKQAEPKITLERNYIIPLRKEWLKVPEYKRVNKAVKAVRQFIVKHMKVYDRDLKKVKIDILLNNELRFRGMRKPPAKIKVKARKQSDGTVNVELFEIPKIIQYKLDREKRKREVVDKKKAVEDKKKAAEAVKKKEEKLEDKAESGEEKKEKEEKKESVKEAGFKQAEQQAKQVKHTSVQKQPKIHRKALAK